MKNKWILQATILGLSFFLAILLVKPIGVSTQFSVLSGKLHYAMDKIAGEGNLITMDDSTKSGYRSTNAYYNRDGGKLAKSIANGIDKDLAFFTSIFAGAFLAKKIHENIRKRKVEEVKIKEQITFLQGVQSFIAGLLLLYGARLADGCTSGHMMSGMMQSSLSGFLFAGIVFMVAIPVAIRGGRKMILSIFLGLCFGAALYIVGANNNRNILDMLRLRYMVIGKMIFFAIGLGATLTGIFAQAGILDISHFHIKTLHGGVALGALIFGVGFGMIGRCPGTCPVAMGSGYLKKGLITFVGGLTGAFLFSLSYGIWEQLGIFSFFNLKKLTLFHVSDQYPSLFSLSYPGLIGMGIVFMAAAVMIPHTIRKQERI